MRDDLKRIVPDLDKNDEPQAIFETERSTDAVAFGGQTPNGAHDRLPITLPLKTTEVIQLQIR
jgi:hypothetical protein